MINFFKIKSDSSIKDEKIDVIDTLIKDRSVITYNINVPDYSDKLYHIYKIRLFRVGDAIDIDDKVLLKFYTDTQEIFHPIKDTNEFYNITDLINSTNNVIKLELFRDTECTRIDSIDLKCYVIDCDTYEDIKEGCDDYTGIPLLQYHSSHADTNLAPYITREDYNNNENIEGYLVEEVRDYNIDLKYFDGIITMDQDTIVNLEFKPRVITKDYIDHWSKPIKKYYITDQQISFRIYDILNNVYLNEYTHIDTSILNKYHIHIDPTIFYKNTIYTLEFTNGQYVWKSPKYNFNI